jgi:hypothetical protein
VRLLSLLKVSCFVVFFLANFLVFGDAFWRRVKNVFNRYDVNILFAQDLEDVLFVTSSAFITILMIKCPGGLAKIRSLLTPTVP